MSSHFAHTSWRLPAAGLAAAGIALILLGTPPVLSSTPLNIPFLPTPVPPPDEVRLRTEDMSGTAYPTITRRGDTVASLYSRMRTQPRDPHQRYGCLLSTKTVAISFLHQGKIIFEGRLIPACGSIESEEGSYSVTEDFQQTLLAISGIWLPDINKP